MSMISRPNILWIFCDQLRVQALGYRGDPNVCTPNIDNLARCGMRFDQAVAGTPWCTPFRAALLTSLYPQANGCPRTPSRLDPSIPTLTQPFRAAGYHTAWIGKWHLAGSNQMVYVEPELRGGFDYWMGYENRNGMNDLDVHGTGQETPVRLHRYETDGLTDLLIDHLRAHVTAGQSQPRAGAPDADAGRGYQPFFATLSVTPPHNPYLAPAEFHRGRNLASIRLRPNVPDVPWIRQQFVNDLCGYYAMIENIDHNVGRIMQALRELNVDRDTYVIFFSDHGDCLGSHGQQQKSSPWEESIRIPFIVANVGGGHRLRVGRCDAVLNHVDIAPTTLGLAGIAPPDWMRGHNYAGHCQHGPTPDPANEPDSAFLQQIPAKQMSHSVNRPWRGVVTRDGWKYVCMPGQDWLLFHNAEDQYELANYAFDSVYEPKRRELHARLARWIEETGDTFELPPGSLQK